MVFRLSQFVISDVVSFEMVVYASFMVNIERGVFRGGHPVRILHLLLAGRFLCELPVHGDTVEYNAVQECEKKGRWTEDK